MPKSVKGLGYIKCCCSSSTRPVKSLSNTSGTTAKRSTVDQEDLKSYWKSEKKPHFSRRSTSLLFSTFSKTLLTTKRRLTGHWFLTVVPSLAFLNT